MFDFDYYGDLPESTLRCSRVSSGGFMAVSAVSSLLAGLRNWSGFLVSTYLVVLEDSLLPGAQLLRDA